MLAATAMTRSLAGWLATVLTAASRGLHSFATTQRYPTRTVEHAFAWVIIVWGYSVLSYPNMLVGKQYEPMLAIMSAAAWGWIAVLISGGRLIGLLCNGHWRPSSEVRLIGALWGMMFWMALSYCYYVAIVIKGAPDFPFRRALFVLIFFEAYSCYRCLYDIFMRGRVNEPRSLAGNYG